MKKSRKSLVVLIAVLIVFGGMCRIYASSTIPAAASTATNPLKLIIPSGSYNFGFYSDSNGNTSIDNLSLSADVSSSQDEWGSSSYKYYAYGTFYVNWSIFTKNAVKLVLSIPKLQSTGGESLPYVDIADTGMVAVVNSDSLLVQSFNTGAIDVGSKQYSIRVDMADVKSTDTYSSVITLKVITV